MNPTSCLFGSRFARNPVFYWLAHFFWWKNPPKCCSILVWIAVCWNYFLTSHNPKNNWCLSRIFGARFGGKDRCLSTCKLWTKQTGGWIHFFMKRLRTLNWTEIFKIKNKNKKPLAVDVLFKTYHSHAPLRSRKTINRVYLCTGFTYFFFV